MRTYSHIIDTKAVKKVINSIPEYCVVRELTERDYGIDLMIEIFTKVGKNKFGHDLFDSTGYVCYLQIKGTESELEIRSDNTISYSIDKSLLLYVEKFSTPFILTRVCTLKGKESIYFLWLQRYISDFLDVKRPKWRTEKPEKLTVYIPAKNDFSSNFEKIEKISWRIKYIEELVEFHEKYYDIQIYFPSIIMDHNKFKGFSSIIKTLNRITQLSTLLSKNTCCIDKDSIEALIRYLQGVKEGTNKPKENEDFPNYFNLDLLKNSTMSTIFVEEMEAEYESVTIY